MFHVKQQKSFDVIVVGAGHAGVEAAVMSSRLGSKTALITFSDDDLGKKCLATLQWEDLEKDIL